MCRMKNLGVSLRHGEYASVFIVDVVWKGNGIRVALRCVGKLNFVV